MIARIRGGVRRRLEMLRHRGDAVECPVCGRSFDHFKPYWNRADALCWRCGSHERHRALWLFLSAHPELLAPGSRLLHLSPEWGIGRRLQEVDGVEYVTADLEGDHVDLNLDLTAIALPDGDFDAVICSHVLEHIPDDGAAMRELRRILRPDGRLVVMVPIDPSREATYEDPEITTPEGRIAAFWQHDHVRLYARDIAERLRSAGFGVEVHNLHAELGPDAAERYGLLPADDIFLCRPASG